MSKRSSLFCVVCALVVALLSLSGDHQLQVASAGRIGDEFLCQDPILMLSHADSRDKLNGASPAFTRDEEEAIVDEETFFSPVEDEYAGEDDEDEQAVLFVGDELAPDLDRSAEGEELADEEEGEEISLLSSHGAIAQGSNGSSEEHGSGGDIECPECGKHFRSNKSMFGHLRSHPERGYKGATPPSVKLRLLPPVNDDGPVARYSQRDANLNAFEILAAYVMLTLKQRDSRIAQDQSVKREPDVLGGEDSVMSKAGDGVERGDKHGNSAAAMSGDGTAGHSEHGSSIAGMGGNDDHPVHQGSSVVVEATPKRGRTEKSKEVREAHRKDKGVLSASKARRPYICKHCKAEFPTHQALGGHMAAHNKERKVQAQNEQAAAAWEAHHNGQVGGGSKEEEQRRRDGLLASTNELLLERYTRLFNQARQPKQDETAVGYKRRCTEKEDGGAIPIAPPVGDRHRLFGVDLSLQAPERE